MLGWIWVCMCMQMICTYACMDRNVCVHMYVCTHTCVCVGGAFVYFSAPWRHVDNLLASFLWTPYHVLTDLSWESKGRDSESLLSPTPHCREGSIVVGYEVTGSSNTAELLYAMEQVTDKALVALSTQFSVKDGSFRVFAEGNAGLPSLIQSFISLHDVLRK